MEPNVNAEVSTKKPSLFGMITSPGMQFERMKTNSPVWGAFFLIVLIGTLSSLAVTHALIQTPEMVKVFAEDPTGMAKTFTYVGGALGGIIGIPVTFFIGAGIYKVIMMLMGNDTSYKQLLSITVYASIISYLGVILNAIFAMALGGDGQVMYTGLGPLFDPKTTIGTIANSIEIFTIWGLIVTGMGLHIVAGLSKNKATILMVIFFLISVGFGLLGNMFGM
ncbi:membrane protein [Bacillus manliponensis]|uniref:Membrane protein n=1 Tax=Bacillus manliponensis TaxID=574376 RepID=A0A073KGI2_9BACI|nr:Yip1 family protein [Bacillus manliponensis]KEK21403.1 membrane protein [Bacillus manliponensis]